MDPPPRSCAVTAEAAGALWHHAEGGAARSVAVTVPVSFTVLGA